MSGSRQDFGQRTDEFLGAVNCQNVVGACNEMRLNVGDQFLRPSNRGVRPTAVDDFAIPDQNRCRHGNAPKRRVGQSGCRTRRRTGIQCRWIDAWDHTWWEAARETSVSMPELTVPIKVDPVSARSGS